MPESRYETQLNQDIFALFVNRFKTGFFVEIGANDGFTLSNTIYLEEFFNWGGILIEANPQYTDDLNRRKAKSVSAAVVDKKGYYQFCSAGLYGGVSELLDKAHKKRTQLGDSITVWGDRLECILVDNNAPRVIDFISVDVEGAEAVIVEQMCGLDNYRFVCGCIEYNARKEDYKKITTLLKGAGYRIVWEGQTQHDLFFIDEELARIGD